MIADLRRGTVRPRARILVLLDPRGAFAAVAARPLSGLVFAAILAFALFPPLTFLARGDVAAVVAHEMKRSGKTDQLTDEQKEKGIEVAAKFMRVALPLGAVMKRAMWMGLLAGLCFAVLKGQRESLKIEALLGAIALAMLPLAVHDVLVAATFLAKDPLTIDAQNPVLSNPAAWLGLDSAHTMAGAALKGLDFFELWSCALVGIGANAIAGTRSTLPYALSFGGQALSVAMATAGAAFAS
jgi:hypothetical protein